MYDISANSDVVIQVLIAVIIIGMFLNLRSSTKLYGGIIGKAVRLFGLGTLFITLSIIEHLLVTFLVIDNTLGIAIAQEIMDLVGLALLGLGFSQLVSATKS